MPYNPAGLFSLVASYFASPGTTIRTEQHNPVFEDVASALSSVLLRDGRAPMTGSLNMNGFSINNVAHGNTPSSVATLAQAMPIGAVIDFAASAAPVGWMLCAGQPVSRTTYAELFSLLGTGYGSGNGSTTFNLPDFRGRVSVGSDDMGGTAANRAPGYLITATGGEASHQLSIGELPILNPTFDGILTTVNVVTSASDYVRSPNFSLINLAGQSPGPYGVLNPGSTRDQVFSSGTITPLGTIRPFGSGSSHNNMQPSLALSKIIRVSYDV